MMILSAMTNHLDPYRGADKSLARPGRKQANVCQNGANFLRRLALQDNKNLMTAHVPNLFPSLFPSWSG